jgi:hypothetical protein
MILPELFGISLGEFGPGNPFLATGSRQSLRAKLVIAISYGASPGSLQSFLDMPHGLRVLVARLAHNL